jgi:hypothetical protein
MDGDIIADLGHSQAQGPANSFGPSGYKSDAAGRSLHHRPSHVLVWTTKLKQVQRE